MKHLFRISNCMVALAILQMAARVATAQSALLGMTSQGGNGYGVIFTMSSSNGSFTAQKNLEQRTPGSEPSFSKLIQVPSGRMYGVTRTGGVNNLGTLFEFDPVTGNHV